MKSLSEMVTEGRNQLERPIDVPDNANFLFIDTTTGDLTFYQGVDAVASMLKESDAEDSEIAEMKKATSKVGGSYLIWGGDGAIFRFG